MSGGRRGNNKGTEIMRATPTQRDLRQELENYSGEFPQSWRSRPGSVVVGRLLRYNRGFSAYGERWIAVLDDDETGEPVAHDGCKTV